MMEVFFNSSEELVQRSESKKSENVVHMQSKQRSVDRRTGMHNLVHGSSSVDRLARAQFMLGFGRPFIRSTDWHDPDFCWCSVDRSVDDRTPTEIRRVGRLSGRPTIRSTGPVRIRTPFLIWSRIQL